MQHAIPSPDDTEDLLLSCRYGDLEDAKSFIDRFGTAPLGEARDENGNTALHMASANGHTELLDYLLPLCPSSLPSAQNHAGSTALHWAALNAHIAAARALVEYPDGPGVSLIEVKNAAGRSPLGEAEAAGWDEGAKWMVEVMRLDDYDKDNDDGGGGDDASGSDGSPRAETEGRGAEVREQPADRVTGRDQDADGRVARASPIAVEQPSVDGSSPQP